MSRALVSAVVLSSFGAGLAGRTLAGEAPAEPGAAGAAGGEYAVFSDERFREAGPGSAVETLRGMMRERDLTFAEAFDYGTAWFLQKRWERALVAYETAAREASKPDERALAYLAAAQSAAMGKQFAEAGRLANVAQRLAPDNGLIAARRVGFWSSADDLLEVRAAEDAVRRLDVRLEGREVCEPGTIIAVACIAAATVISLYAIHEGALTTEDIMKIIRELMFTVPGALIMKKMLPNGGPGSGST